MAVKNIADSGSNGQSLTFYDRINAIGGAQSEDPFDMGINHAVDQALDIASEADALIAHMLEALCQYVDDLQYPPVGDSIQRRIDRAKAVMARAVAR